MVTELLVSLALAGPASGVDAADQASRLARRAVADELGVTEAEAVVETVEAVVWPDSGLGCAAKGEVNAAVLTRGHRVGVRVGGATYHVHVGAGRARLCPEPSSPREEFLGAGLKVAAAARKDLAARLAVEPGDVRLVSMKPTTWPDARLGCPGPAPAEPAATKGFVLTLEARGKQHLYHADTERAVACED